jgi:hypothetical protein
MTFQINFHFDYPEQEVKPSETLKALYQQYQNRGIADKRQFTNKMIANGFTIQRAAEHPNCPSARYFLTKLQGLATAN